MMSAAQSKKLRSKLEALQCHFTWDLDPKGSNLLHLKDDLEDIGSEVGNRWLAHIYNLRGFIQFKLGNTEDAQSLFKKATDAFPNVRNADEGPWLVVNYGNLAWLHYYKGEQAESEAYLSKVDALENEYPSPSQDELHPEIYAEKAWTLMNFSTDKKLLAADYFQKAIRMQPDMVEWHTSRIVGLASASKHCSTGLEADVFEQMRMAKEQDPENLYLAVQYLNQRDKKGENIEDETRELARQILLTNPVSSYSGLKPLLRLHRNDRLIDKAIGLAEEALEKHPDERYLKTCVALCLKWKILQFSGSHPNQSLIDRAISLHKEVISLYPHSCLVKRIDLASLYVKSNHSQAKGEQIYQELLEGDYEPGEKQLIYNSYAKHLNSVKHDGNKSIQYHMMAAAIPTQSFYRDSSIKILKKIRVRNRMCREITEFLKNLPEPQ